MRPREIIKYLGGLGLAGLLLWWVLRGTEPGLLWDRMRQASLAGILLSAALNIGHNVFRVLRWRALLTPLRPGIPFRPMFSAVILGYMTSWIVPGRLGELVRPLLLSGETGLPVGPLIGSVVADRLLDVAAVVTLFTLGSWLTPLEGQAAEYVATIRVASLLMVAGVVGGLAAMLAVSRARGGFVEGLRRRRGAVGRFARTVLSITEGVGALRSPRLTLIVAAHSLLAWLTISLGTWIGIRAVGAEISPGAMLVILPMLVLGVAVPTPGGVGSYHGLMKFGLLLFGVTELTATSAAVLVHVSITVPVILLGTVLLWTEGISWRRLVTAARRLGAVGGNPSSGKTMESVP